MKIIRQSTVKPVFGTLTQFMGMRKVNTRGIVQANKVMLLAATAYNLKKYLNFRRGKVVSMAATVKNAQNRIKRTYILFLRKIDELWLEINPQAVLKFLSIK